MKAGKTGKIAIATGISRRAVFRAGAATVGTLLAVVSMGSAAIAKMTQRAAQYQEKPKDAQQCSNCTLFKAPDSCTLVDGTISAGGWCRFYAKKSA